MIVVNEPLASAREIPFFLPLSNDPLNGLTGHTFLLGEVKYRLPGGSYVDAAVVDVSEKGQGAYVLRLAQNQTLVSGFAYVYANVTGAQPYSGSELIATQGGGILVNEANDNKRELAFHLPDSTNPLNPITGHSFVTGQVQIALPGGAFTNADVTRVVEKGFGDYALRLTNAQVANRGKVFLYVNIGASAQRWLNYYDVVATTAGELITLANIQPVPGQPLLPDTPIFFEVTSDSGNPVVLPRIIMDPFVESELVWDVVANDFEPFYKDRSSRESITNGYRWTVRRKGGWFGMPRLVIENASGTILYP